MATYSVTPEHLAALIEEIEQERRAVQTLMDEDVRLSASELRDFSCRDEKLRCLWGYVLAVKTDIEKLSPGKGDAEARLGQMEFSKCDAFVAACKAAAE